MGDEPPHIPQNGSATTPSNDKSWSRRHYLVATVGIAALSGCTSGGTESGTGTPTGTSGGGDTATTAAGTPTESSGESSGEGLPEGVSEDEFTHGPVPEMYRTAVSLGGEEREPDSLLTKENAQFAEHDGATENAAYESGSACGNCSEFIHDKNGDGLGACVKVEGYIGFHDWCTLYESPSEPSVPEGLSEDDLATASVPEQYRTATAQGGEDRNPDELQSQEAVRYQEAVEATNSGLAEPGQSCGTCAEFVPDQNGDGWGACVKVQGYIAVENWCSRYEHVTEALD